MPQPIIVFGGDAAVGTLALREQDAIGDIEAALMCVYGWDGRAAGDDFVGFKGLVGGAIGLLDLGGAGGVNGEEVCWGLFRDDTSGSLG